MSAVKAMPQNTNKNIEIMGENIIKALFGGFCPRKYPVATSPTGGLVVQILCFRIGHPQSHPAVPVPGNQSKDFCLEILFNNFLSFVENFSSNQCSYQYPRDSF